MMKKYLALIAVVCLIFSCDDRTVSTIPYATVRFELDLNFQDNALKAKLAYKTFTATNPNSDERFGYAGLLIVNGIGEGLVNLYAYDLACPVEVPERVRIQPNASGLTAHCPKCGSVFDIAYGRGTPQSGTKLILRTYRVGDLGNYRYLVSN
ncbi:MAG: hypothetical protein LBN18_09060 [Dysgonamonadaceae bacterium]|jgi:hypothetical protein|nr:hypothetical protein [Dysgonamonadaceae bacterium]